MRRILHVILILFFLPCPHFSFAVADIEHLSFLQPEQTGGVLHLRVESTPISPLPCCLTLIDSQGKGVWGKDGLGKSFQYPGDARIWVSGDTQINLPAGSYTYIVSRPYAYQTKQGTVDIVSGQTTLLSLTLACVLDLPSLGWYGGDAHQHICHGEKEFAVNAGIACKIAQSEGADWSSFNSAYSSFPDDHPSLDDVRKVCQKMSNAHFLGIVGDEYPKDHLGHMVYLPGDNADWKKEIGYNQYSYPEGHHEDFLHTYIMQEVKNRGGVCLYTHPLREYGGTKESPANIARELPLSLLIAPHLLKSIDWLTDNPVDSRIMQCWSMYLNWGYEIGICAFTDTCYDRKDGRPINKKTYVYLGDQKPSPFRIAQAIQEGKTIASSGPLMTVSVDGEVPGARFAADGQARELQIHAFAPSVDYEDRSVYPYLTQVEIIRNGKTWQLFPLSNIREFQKFIPIQEKENAWYVVRVMSSGKRQVGISSPFYFRSDDFTKPEAWMALARYTILDAKTKKPVEARVISSPGKTLPEENVFRFQQVEPKSQGSIGCPAHHYLHVRAEGYQATSKNLILDVPEIYNELLLPLKREDILNPDYYQKLRDAIQGIHLDIELEKE
jgi:hypothetical protein